MTSEARPPESNRPRSDRPRPGADRACFVHIVLPGETGFTVAGRFRASRTPDGTPIGEFVYGRSYLERRGAVELDPRELTLGRGQRRTARLGGMFGALRDSMPDAWGRRLVERRLGRTDLDEFDYLTAGSRDRAGALGFSDDPSPPAAEAPRSTPTLERLAAEAAILAGEPGAAAPPARELLFPGTSLGGARPKTTVLDGDRLWLAKFGLPGDRWDESRVEHAMLRLAARCGIRAAESRVEAVGGGRSVLLVRRFDRARSGTGFLRRRQISALTLLGADDSPTDRRGWSYLELADEIRRTSVRNREDLRELFLRMGFNAAAGNTDDHPRNHCLTADAAGWRLGPAYDLTPTPGASAEPPDLALTCGRHGRRGSRENLLSGAPRFLLDRPDAEALLDGVLRAVAAGWREALAEAGVSLRDAETVAPAFSPSVRSAE